MGFGKMVSTAMKGMKKDGHSDCVVWLHPDGKLFVCDKQGYPFSDGGKKRYDIDQAKQLAKTLKGKGVRVRLKKQGNTLNRGSEQKIEMYAGDFHRMVGVGPTVVERASGGERAMLDVLSKAFSAKVKPQDVRYIRYRTFKGDVEMEDVADRLGGILTSVGKNEVDTKSLITYLKKKGAKPMKEDAPVFDTALLGEVSPSRKDIEKALEKDTKDLRKYKADLRKLKQGKKVPNLTVQGAKDQIRGLKGAIQNKKKALKRMEGVEDEDEGVEFDEAKRRTFKKAKEEILDYLQKEGWKVKRHLKVPHATSPDGEVRLWFKSQALYFSGGEGTSLKNAHSVHTDIRTKSPEEVVKYAVRFARNEAIEALYDECPECMQEVLAAIVEAKKGHGPPAPKDIRDTIVRYYDDCREKQSDKSKEYCARVAWTRFCKHKDPDHPSCTEYGKTDKRSAPVSEASEDEIMALSSEERAEVLLDTAEKSLSRVPKELQKLVKRLHKKAKAKGAETYAEKMPIKWIRDEVHFLRDVIDGKKHVSSGKVTDRRAGYNYTSPAGSLTIGVGAPGTGHKVKVHYTVSIEEVGKHAKL